MADAVETREEAAAPGRQVGGLVGRLLVTVAAAVFMALFVDAVRDLGWQAAGFPYLVMSVLSVALVVDLIQTVVRWRAADPGTRARPFPSVELTRRQWLQTATVMGALLVFIWGIRRIGFYESALPFLAVVFATLGIRRPLPLIAMVGGTLLAAWLLFDVGLRVLLPPGLLI